MCIVLVPPKIHQMKRINLQLVCLFFLGLTKLGNIEEFFNQNFFKKTRKSEPKERSYPKDEFGGSPESDYEPSLTSFQSEAWNDHKISGR
jgi:hypothetical protein